MNRRRQLGKILAALPFAACFARVARAQTPPPAAAPAATDQRGMEMLTVFLRHDESKTVDEINQHLKGTGWFAHFPPPWVEIVSWYVMMGIGQVVTVRFPAERLRELNRLIEGEAWGGYRTEFYPTYDYRALYARLQDRMK